MLRDLWPWLALWGWLSAVLQGLIVFFVVRGMTVWAVLATVAMCLIFAVGFANGVQQ